MGLATLKRRTEFLRVRGGYRWSTPAMVLEAKPRQTRTDDADAALQVPRFGFTVSRQVGKAVVRNRVRRRLKAAAAELVHLARPGLDYVIIARPPAGERRYAELRADLTQALARVHRAAESKRGQ